MGAGAEGLGEYSINLNAFFNPNGWSCIIPDLPLAHAGQNEGLAYLGFGFLILLPIAGLIILCTVFTADGEKWVVTHKWQLLLVTVLAALTFLLALSPKITWGSSVLLEMQLPALLIKLWSVFRASGRFAWVLFYPLYFVVLIFTLGKIPAKWNVLLSAVVVVCSLAQILDFHTHLETIHNHYAEKAELDTEFQNDLWLSIAEDSEISHMILTSAYNANPFPAYEIAEYASEQHMTLNRFVLARGNNDIIEKSLQESLTNLSEDSLYVFKTREQFSCLNYPLHFYHSDNFIAGSLLPIPGQQELGEELKNYHYLFEGTDVENGEDTDGIRTLYESGISREPKISVSPGVYQIQIEGSNLSQLLYYGQFDDGANVYGTINDYCDEKVLQFEIEIYEPLTDFEIFLQNTGSDNVELTSLTIKNISS